MRTIRLNQRQARLLRDNLVGNQAGYDYVELVKLDALSKRLSELQGAYGERMAELAREERQARRQLVKAESPVTTEAANKALALIVFEVQDLHEAASNTDVVLKVTDGEWALINDKLDGVTQWIGGDDLRPAIIGMVEAVHNAESDEADEDRPAEVKQLRRRS